MTHKVKYQKGELYNRKNLEQLLGLLRCDELIEVSVELKENSITIPKLISSVKVEDTIKVNVEPMTTKEITATTPQCNTVEVDGDEIPKKRGRGRPKGSKNKVRIMANVYDVPQFNQM